MQVKADLYDSTWEQASLVELLAHHRLSRLDSLEPVPPQGLTALVERKPAAYRVIGFESDEIDSAQWPGFIDALSRLPRLTTLRAEVYAAKELSTIRPLLEARLPDRIELLELVTRETGGLGEALSSILDALDASSFQRVRVRWTQRHDDGHAGYGLCLTRDDSGELTEVEAALFPRYRTNGCVDDAQDAQVTRFWLSPLVEEFKTLSDRPLTRFRLARAEGVDALPSSEELQALQELLAKIPTLRSTALLPAGDSPEAVSALCGALAGPAEREAILAARKLGAFRIEEARLELARCVRDGEPPTLRFAALEALASFADASTIRPLCAALARVDCPSAWMASELLGYLRAESAVDDLLAYLQGAPGEWEQGRVIGDLARIASIRAAPALLERHRSAPGDALLQALARLRCQEVLQPAREAFAAGRLDASAYALGLLGEPADRELVAGLVKANHRLFFTAGLPLLVTLLMGPSDATKRQTRSLGQAIKKWGAGIKEEAADLVLELARRRPSPSPEHWRELAAAVQSWCGECAQWARRYTDNPSLDAAKWQYWLRVVDGVSAAWTASPRDSV